jgi:hypothetical protein
MKELTDEELLKLIMAGDDWESIKEILGDICEDDLIRLLNQLSTIIEVIKINEYVRLEE